MDWCAPFSPKLTGGKKTIFLALTFVLCERTFATDQTEATVLALRMSNSITFGLLTPQDPLFSQMVTQIMVGNIRGAAEIAAFSRYFPSSVGRRMAFQMQNPNLDAGIVTESDATAFLIAKFVGGLDPNGNVVFPPSLSTIWSENATYVPMVNGAPVRAAALTQAQIASINWLTQLQRQPNQSARAADTNGNPQSNGTTVQIPERHVGGYTTLSDRGTDNSFAMFATTAGTNLRFIEGIWEIATGLELMDVASSDAHIEDTPRFIPQNDPNFLIGQGQPACMACHGGGMANLDHGYATVADRFNADPDGDGGLVYIANPAQNQRKSLGSNPGGRGTVNTCNLTQSPTPVCNPDSPLPTQTPISNEGWDLQKWADTGVLTKMGWTGEEAGEGLNELGAALGQASIVYENFTRRIVREICPLGMFTPSEVKSIASSANPFATPAGTDDLRTLVALVASHGSCL